MILIAFAFIVWAASREARYEVRFALVIFDFIRDSDNGEVLLVGFMFGIFFSIWFNTIISRRANEAFGYRDAVIVSFRSFLPVLLTRNCPGALSLA